MKAMAADKGKNRSENREGKIPETKKTGTRRRMDG
jgi:hypothetical protein